METLLLPNVRKGALRTRGNFLEIIQLELVLRDAPTKHMETVLMRYAWRHLIAQLELSVMIIQVVASLNVQFF